MLKELMLIGTLLSPNIQEPNRAITEVNAYEIINASPSRIMLYQGYSDEEVDFSGKSTGYYPYKVKTDDDFKLSVYKADYPTAPTDFYYIYNAPDYEDPVSITNWTSNTYTWTATIGGYEPSKGLQVGRYESLAGVHAYLDYSKLGITSSYGLDMDRYVNLLETGVSVSVVNSSGAISTALQTLQGYKSSTMMSGSAHYVGIYGTNNHSYILASNLTSGSADYQPMLFWQHNLTNEFVFQSGNYSIKYGELNGLLPYYFTLENQGYLAYDPEQVTQVYDTLTTAFEMVGKALGLLAGAFGWIIFPGISIGFLLLVPTIISLFVWLIRFLKKG